MLKWKLRDGDSIYEDARQLGLVLIGAGSLGLAGFGELAADALTIVGSGAVAYVFSVLRPRFRKKKDDRCWRN